jgi:hypothetical protein
MKEGDRPQGRLINADGEVVYLDDGVRRIKRLRKRVSRWGREIAEPAIADGRGVLLMVTLTYKPGDEPKAGDRKTFMRRVRRRLGDALLGYTNVAELTKKGVPHFHYLMLLRRGAWLPEPDSTGLWTHGSTNVKRNLRTAGYLLKYVSKSEVGEFNLPKGMRAYDVRARVCAFFSSSSLMALRLSAIPKWLEDEVRDWCMETGHFPEKKIGGIWLMSGEEYKSPWQYQPPSRDARRFSGREARRNANA